MIEELLEDILQESKAHTSDSPSEQIFIETILNNIYQFLYKRGHPVHTIAIGILRGNTFDMYYKGRIIERYAEIFGAMSYETTIAGKACEQFKKEGKPYLHMYTRKQIIKEFELASKDLKELGKKEEAEALKKRAKTTIDQGIGSFLVMPLSFGNKVNGIFTISSLKEAEKNHILGEDIEKKFVPIAQILSLILYMEKISYDKAEEMGRLLISSIDGKDEYQATHSLNVRTMIDIFIDELSRDKELRERVEGIGFKLTVDKIERLRLAALLHDMGKVFVPSSILRKYGLNQEELLIRKMHSYYTYNILSHSKTLRDIADIASMHHARYYIPKEKYEQNLIGYPFDRFGQDKFSPESQIIAIADTINSIIRARPDRKGLSLTDAFKIIDKEEYKFHGGLKDIFLIITRRVKQNLEKGFYPPHLAEEYRSCLWLEKSDEEKKKENNHWTDLYKFIKKIDYNTIGIVSVMNWKDAKFLLDEEISINNHPLNITKIENKHVVISIIGIPKEEGFIWINKLYEQLKARSFKGKISFAFVGRSGCSVSLDKMFKSLTKGLQDIKNEPVHYFLNPDMFCCI